MLLNSEVNENITEFEEYREDIRTMKGEITDELVKVDGPLENQKG